MEQQRSRRRLLTLAALALMTNGFTLLGHAHGSAGAVAQNLETRQEIARQGSNERDARQGLESPPLKRTNWLPERFERTSLRGCEGKL
ncbi:hypothetical protein [Metapseudomonas otitidis]|uniref:hypothetical protein n=1 Tax=Metapseudomonas otitidis TaxID=319939 RepID=UPI00244BFF96|nr:hypothetical protein [Pseudomonas otitidis]MDH0336261.1 hypothetical protein [Pseudomonas otitidis]